MVRVKAGIKLFVETSKVESVLPYNIDFVIPGFEKSYPKGVFKCLSFSDRPSEEWFLSFVDEVENAIGKRFLPIYRMGNGEFMFCVGYRYQYRANGESLSLYATRTLRSVLGRLRQWLFRKRSVFRTGNLIISGDYTRQEMKSMRRSYIEQLRSIGEQGYLALKFSHRRDFVFTQQYFVPMVHWLETQDIHLHRNNYVPVYFIYAMLTGPFRHRIYRGRRVLVVTSYDDAKRDAIAKGLECEGVANVQFLPLSQGRSMYDTIDLSSIRRPVDLVLVGGGIGASNILCQLESLMTVAIDAGYVIECLADPERKKQRSFCWPDEERNGDYSPI